MAWRDALQDASAEGSNNATLAQRLEAKLTDLSTRSRSRANSIASRAGHAVHEAEEKLYQLAIELARKDKSSSTTSTFPPSSATTSTSCPAIDSSPSRIGQLWCAARSRSTTRPVTSTPISGDLPPSCRSSGQARDWMIRRHRWIGWCRPSTFLQLPSVSPCRSRGT